MGKVKNIEFETVKGEKKKIAVIESDVSSLSSLFCEKCSYYAICEKLPDPRNVEDEDSDFPTFCSEICELSDEDREKKRDMDVVLAYYPMEGEIEGLFEGLPIYEKVLEANKMVRLTDVMDGICKTWCELYNENHKCDIDNNKMCMMKEILNARTKRIQKHADEELEKQRAGEGDTQDNKITDEKSC